MLNKHAAVSLNLTAVKWWNCRIIYSPSVVGYEEHCGVNKPLLGTSLFVISAHQSFCLVHFFFRFNDLTIYISFASVWIRAHTDCSSSFSPHLTAILKMFTLNSHFLIPTPSQGVFVFAQLNLRETHWSCCVCVGAHSSQGPLTDMDSNLPLEMWLCLAEASENYLNQSLFIGEDWHCLYSTIEKSSSLSE